MHATRGFCNRDIQAIVDDDSRRPIQTQPTSSRDRLSRQCSQRPRRQIFFSDLDPIDAGSSDQEVTKAYRRQMSRHHPDKLVANGLPESMAQVAKEKTQRIQEAYEAIRAARGMR